MHKLSRSSDLLLAAALAAAALAEIWLRDLESRPALLVMGVLVPLTLVWRLRFPVAVLGLNLAASVVVELLSPRDDYPISLGVVLLVAVYTVGAHIDGRAATVAAAMCAAGVLASAAAREEFTESENRTNVIVGLLVLTVLFRAAWLAGRWVRRRRAREEALVAEREEQARAALAEERARIARELHDVLAHAISVIVLQARGARHALSRAPEDARAALGAIEGTASQALTEMRRLLTVLRTDDEEAARAPQPSLAQIEPLLAQVRAAGLPVELHVEGRSRELAPGVDLCAYRIVQEALTNALRHAGPARAQVLLRYRDDALELEVADTGIGDGNGGAAGHGLAGMRERVALFGGQLESGPRVEGGYLVRARLPL